MQRISNTIHIALQLNPRAGSDAEELDRMTRQLFTEIQELEVDSVTLVRDGTPPAGTKSGELVTLGSLAVVVLPTIAPKLIELLQSWLMRSENNTIRIKAQVDNRSIKVEYSPATMSADELKRLVTSLTEAMPSA